MRMSEMLRIGGEAALQWPEEHRNAWAIIDGEPLWAQHGCDGRTALKKVREAIDAGKNVLC